MVDALKEFFNFFIDKEHRISKRLSMAIIIIAGLILADNYINFSFNIRKDNQIKQIKDIEDIIKLTKDSILINELKKIENQIIEKKNFSDYLSSFFTSLYVSAKNSIKQRSTTPNNPKPIYNYFWHFISTNWLFIIMTIAVFYEFLVKDKITTQSIGTLILITLLMIAIMFGLAGLTGLFQPIFKDKILVDYGINVLITFILIMTPSLLGRRKK